MLVGFTLTNAISAYPLFYNVKYNGVFDMGILPRVFDKGKKRNTFKRHLGFPSILMTY
jgi:hypothetical protein